MKKATHFKKLTKPHADNGDRLQEGDKILNITDFSIKAIFM